MHLKTPFRRDKNLGRAYNEAFEDLKKDDWLVIRDIDTLFLSHDAPNIIEDYITKYPETGIFTCFTNRIGCKDQLYKGVINQDPNILVHLDIANRIKNDRTKFQIKSPISGMLMVVQKKTWIDNKFSDGCLGVDNDFSKRILASGLKIFRMNGLYIWHTYRINTSVSNTKHLL